MYKPKPLPTCIKSVSRSAGRRYRVMIYLRSDKRSIHLGEYARLLDAIQVKAIAKQALKEKPKATKVEINKLVNRYRASIGLVKLKIYIHG